MRNNKDFNSKFSHKLTTVRYNLSVGSHSLNFVEIRGYMKPIKLEVKKACSRHSFIIYSFKKLNFFGARCVFQVVEGPHLTHRPSYSLFSKLLLI